jgi:hypothetical protein
VLRPRRSNKCWRSWARSEAGLWSYEPELNAKGERLIWLEPRVVDRLRSLRGWGESYSDVILRLAAEGEQRTVHS